MSTDSSTWRIRADKGQYVLTCARCGKTFTLPTKAVEDLRSLPLSVLWTVASSHDLNTPGHP